MTTRLPFLATLAACVALPIAALAWDDDEVQLADVPQPAADAIRTALGDARLDEIERITVDGNTLYVAEADAPGGDVTVHVTAAGVVVRRVEDVDDGALPQAVADAVAAYAGSIDDVDMITEDGATTWEIDIDAQDGSDIDLVVAADGTIVSETVDRD